MTIEEISTLFEKYGFKNFSNNKTSYIFESAGSNIKISNALFDKMLKAVNNANTIDITLPNLTFGVELEFVGSNNYNDIIAFNDAMEALVGTSYRCEGRYTHNTGYDWILGKDGSIIYTSTPDNPLFGFELSTPKLTLCKKDITILNTVIEYIKKYLHGEVNSSCGTHIHIGFDCDKIYRSDIETLLMVYSGMESTVFDPIVPTSRRRNKYCKSTCVGLSAKYRKLSARFCKFNFDRECKVFHIECRQLEGTLDCNTIINWLIFQSTIIYDIISHINDAGYLYRLRYSNAFEILFRYKFTNDLITFFIKRIIEFKSRTIQTTNRITP